MPRPRRMRWSSRSVGPTRVAPPPADRSRRPPAVARGGGVRSYRAVRAEQLTDAVAFHAEGPVWSVQWGGLRWVDMLAGDVLSLGDDGTVTRRHVGTVAAALRPRVGGGAG